MPLRRAGLACAIRLHRPDLKLKMPAQVFCMSWCNLTLSSGWSAERKRAAAGGGGRNRGGRRRKTVEGQRKAAKRQRKAAKRQRKGSKRQRKAAADSDIVKHTVAEAADSRRAGSGGGGDGQARAGAGRAAAARTVGGGAVCRSGCVAVDETVTPLPPTFRRCVNSDGERSSAKWQSRQRLRVLSARVLSFCCAPLSFQ